MVGNNRTRDFALEDEPRPDTEVTLGPVLLLLLGCGLLLLCATCFGAGYLMGRRGTTHADTATVPSVNGQQLVPAQVASTPAKPTAGGTAAAPAAQQPVNEAPLEADAAPGETNGSAAAASGAVAAGPQSVSATAAPAAHPQPAANGPMVQIAAVSHAEDADVLMSALRKRGYAVTARRVAGDSLIHVQLGPFASRTEANAMSQKLLADGYNAVVLP